MTKLIVLKSGQTNPFDRAYTADSGITWKKVAKAPERRYTLQSDGNNIFFVEIGMEAEFQAFLDSLYESTGYEGHDYSKNVVSIKHFSKRADFTFTDPRIR